MINSAELILAVDTNDQPIHPMTREFIHQQKFWHRTSHIWIVNSKGEILCHQRSAHKHTAANKWEACFGGHIAHNEDYLSGAIKELLEETGLKATAADLNFYTIYKNEEEKEFQAVYYLGWDGDFSNLDIEDEEVQQIKWLPLEQVEAILDTDDNWLKNGYARELLEHLKSLSI